MTRDTFDNFQQPERGRFGDNEAAEPKARSKPRVTGASDLIDLTLRLMKDNPLSIAVTDPAKRDGKWIFLPKSQIEYRDIGHGTVIVTLPGWLAEDKGLA
jgi:hypothetical protein